MPIVHICNHLVEWLAILGSVSVPGVVLLEIYGVQRASRGVLWTKLG